MKKARKPDLKQGKKALKKTEPNKSGPVVLVVNKLNLLERLPQTGEKSHKTAPQGNLMANGG